MNEERHRHVIRWPEHAIEMAFRLIPAGSFRMGSRGYSSAEEPVHLVKISESFWLGETAVTQAQFALWTQSEKIDHQNHCQGHPDHPAENVDWRQSVSYCAWLAASKAQKLPEDVRLACLPTEAEWEYACRAGRKTEYYTGDGEAALAEAGWFGEDYDSGSTHPVGQKTANGFGLYDMHGNVWEWCHDAYEETAYRERIDGDGDRGRGQRWHDWRAGVSSLIESDGAGRRMPDLAGAQFPREAGRNFMAKNG